MAKVKEEVKVIKGFPSLKELLEAGSHFGHIVKRWNPKMQDYIFAVRKGVHIFDLVKTRDNLKKAADYLEGVVAKGGTVLVVGIKAQAADLVRAEADRLKFAYITNRWVGGLFTNWEQLKGRVEKLVTIRNKFEAGDYKKYTKKEQIIIKRDIDRLERMYGGMVDMKKLPDVIVIVDPTREFTAIHESMACNIPIVAICDSNCDPSGIAYVIPANDDAIKSVTLIMTALTHAIERGMKVAKKAIQA